MSLLAIALRQAARIRRQDDQIGRLLAGYRRANEGWRRANDERDGDLKLAEGWKRRAEALYLIADPDKRDGVMECLTWIERQPEVKP